MNKHNKYFRTTSLVKVIDDLAKTGESFLLLNDLSNISSAIRYANSALNKKNVNASISKVQFIWNDEVITGLYLKLKGEV